MKSSLTPPPPPPQPPHRCSYHRPHHHNDHHDVLGPSLRAPPPLPPPAGQWETLHPPSSPSPTSPFTLTLALVGTLALAPRRPPSTTTFFKFLTVPRSRFYPVPFLLLFFLVPLLFYFSISSYDLSSYLLQPTPLPPPSLHLPYIAESSTSTQHHICQTRYFSSYVFPLLRLGQLLFFSSSFYSLFFSLLLLLLQPLFSSFSIPPPFFSYNYFLFSPPPSYSSTSSSSTPSPTILAVTDRSHSCAFTGEDFS